MTRLEEALILQPGQSRGRIDRALKVGAAETGGGFALRVNAAVPPGRWIDDHRHLEEEEAWFVLDGVLTFRLDGRLIDAPQGTFILVPRGTTHGFGNLGSESAAFLQVFCPAGMEEYFEERAALAEATPTGESDFAGLPRAAHIALAAKYHMEFVELPPPDRR